MKLEAFLKYDNIVIQCHDIPDADTIASGYGLLCFFEGRGKKVRLVYSGKKRISKPSLMIMINKLKIPIEYVHKLRLKPKLLICVDCVCGEGNVTRLEAENYAAIDHHRSVQKSSEMFDIRPAHGSCSSVIALLLSQAGFDYNSNKRLATALYYGLYTDTDDLREVSHPADRDLRDFAKYDKRVISTLINSNISLSELRIAGSAFLNTFYNEKYHFAVALAKECDPNILGFINDLILKVDGVTTSIVCCRAVGGIKMSVRSCNYEISAAEIADFLTENIGSGGGGSTKAGGFINESLAPQIIKGDPSEFIRVKVTEYFETLDIIHCGRYFPDLSGMKVYLKKPQLMGVVKTTELFPPGTDFEIRALEADIKSQAAEDIYIMIGKYGTVYRISKEKFDSTYTLSNDKFEIIDEYSPNIIAKNGTRYSLLDYAKGCVLTSRAEVYATQLTCRTKLYTMWDKENYMSGKAGDFLVIRCDDTNDMYIVPENQFDDIYDEKE